MNTTTVQRKTQRDLLDIPTAAFQAGYSPRHFRKVIEEDSIPVMQIWRRLFISGRDLEAWKSTRGEARFQQALDQLEVWIKQDLRYLQEPAEEWDDED